jgi:hypothetical protein
MPGYHIAERSCRNQGHRSWHLEEVGGQVLREERVLCDDEIVLVLIVHLDLVKLGSGLETP